QAHSFGEPHAVGERVSHPFVMLHARAACGGSEGGGMHADEHPRACFAVAVKRDGFAVPLLEERFHSFGVWAAFFSSLGCSTTASTRGAISRAGRTTPPVRVSSRTST